MAKCIPGAWVQHSKCGRLANLQFTPVILWMNVLKQDKNIWNTQLYRHTRSEVITWRYTLPEFVPSALLSLWLWSIICHTVHLVCQICIAHNKPYIELHCHVTAGTLTQASVQQLTLSDKLFKRNPLGKQNRGRSRNTWRTDIEADINMGMTWNQLERKD
jgi:hypothetical protein